MKKKRLLMMLLTAAVLLLTASCSKDDDEPQPVNPPVAAGARLQVMMVFAPGQLGDGGYADGLLEYASGMEFLEIMPDAEDSIDVQFISLYSVNDTRQALKEWAAAVTHPFYKDATYERRLLVLTEPYMTAWLADVKTNLRETDEVLIMKADEAYTQQVANTYGLGNRAHGLNYDLAPSIRLYCDNVRCMLKSVIAHGKVPVLPKIPFAADPAVGKRLPAYNAVIDRLWAEFGDKLIKGPDFENYFRNHTDQLSDGVHPTQEGYEAMRRIWAETMYERVYR